MVHLLLLLNMQILFCLKLWVRDSASFSPNLQPDAPVSFTEKFIISTLPWNAICQIVFHLFLDPFLDILLLWSGHLFRQFRTSVNTVTLQKVFPLKLKHDSTLPFNYFKLYFSREPENDCQVSKHQYIHWVSDQDYIKFVSYFRNTWSIPL